MRELGGDERAPERQKGDHEQPEQIPLAPLLQKEGEAVDGEQEADAAGKGVDPDGRGKLRRKGQLIEQQETVLEQQINSQEEGQRRECFAHEGFLRYNSK